MEAYRVSALNAFYKRIEMPCADRGGEPSGSLTGVPAAQLGN
jgi:hypothetical protein